MATSNTIASAQSYATDFCGALPPTPGRGRGCFLEDVMFMLGSQSMKSSFPGEGPPKQSICPKACRSGRSRCALEKEGGSLPTA